MNPHYNQQQPYYNYQQHVPGPPQPSWQSPGPQSPTGWNDPRFQTVLPPPSHPPQSPQYGQSGFTPLPNQTYQYPPPPPTPPQPTGPHAQAASVGARPHENYNRPTSPQYDTSQWGVKYNQGQFNQHLPDSQQTHQPEQKPALPPRPGSSLAHAAQHQHASSVGGYQQAQAQYQPQGSWNVPFNQPQEHQAPAPPPRPTEYPTGSQYGQTGLPQEQYSHHAATHLYDPQPPPQPSWQMPQQQQAAPSHQPAPPTWNQYSQSAEGPVSPMEDFKHKPSLSGQSGTDFVDNEPPSQNVQLPTSRPSRASLSGSPSTQMSSVALGAYSGPTDWQHYDLSEPQETGVESVKPANKPSDRYSDSPMLPSHTIRRKSIERVRPSSQSGSPKVQHSSPQRSTPQDNVQKSGPSAQGPARVQSPLGQIPERQDSGLSMVSSVSGTRRNDSIDNIIQAWKAPLMIDSSIQTSLPPTRPASRHEETPVLPKIETADREVQTDFKPQVETKIETRIETKVVETDPYADIQDQYKSTLKRFAEMLRQEAATEKDEEKFKVFQGFVIHELRLRSVLYGVEMHPQEPTKAEVTTDGDSTPVAADIHPGEQPSDQGQSRSVAEAKSSTQQNPPKLSTKTPTSPDSKDDSFVVLNSKGDEEDQYSPGGRPRISPLRIKTPKPADATQTTDSSQRPPSPTRKGKDSGTISPGTNAPMTLDDYTMPEQVSPSANAPMVVGADNLVTRPVDSQVTGPLNFQPSRPLYQPFRYGEGSNEQVPTVQVHGPPVESFAALRQSNAAESGRELVHDAPSPSVSPIPDRSRTTSPFSGQRENEEAFIGLIRAKSQAIRKKVNTTPRPDSPAVLRAGTPLNRSTSSPTPIPPLVKSIQSLRQMIPKPLPSLPGPKSPPHPKLGPISTSARAIPDDFSFIHARVLTWDKSNRQLRAKLDSERQTRQGQNEEHIDQLFHDNEIGYADIAELEKDFKLEEAGKKYKEDQDELETFTKSVFEYVVAKLDGEIRELTKFQTNAIDMLDLESTSAARQIQSSFAQQTAGANQSAVPPISAVMQLLVELQDKLEIRHVKIAEAKFERERRRKRLELSVLYTNNDKAGIRKLEAEFSKAEKLQMMEESRKKAERANRLMDSFDRAVVRGLAENQGLADDMLSRLQLVRDLILGSEDHMPAGQEREDFLYGPDGVRDLVDRTAATVDFIHNDSKTLIQALDKADSLANNADFELYISEAKLADASPEKFQKLKGEKEAEDRNVQDELRSRLSGVARTPQEITSLVREVKDKIGGDVGHEERIGKALEAAKRRNTGLGG